MTSGGFCGYEAPRCFRHILKTGQNPRKMHAFQSRRPKLTPGSGTANAVWGQRVLVITGLVGTGESDRLVGGWKRNLQALVLIDLLRFEPPHMSIEHRTRRTNGRDADRYNAENEKHAR